MPDKNTVYIHVGLPKTASTFLQKKVFPYLTGIEFVDKRLVFRSLDRVSTQNTGRVLLSHEGIIKNNTSGQIADNRRLKRLSNALPSAVPILFLRRHDRWAKSRYTYALLKGETRTFDEFTALDSPTGTVTRAEMTYRTDIELLESCFATPPLVFFHEELIASPEDTVRLLADSIGAGVPQRLLSSPGSRVNASFGEKQLLYMRAFSRSFVGKQRRGGLLPRRLRSRMRTNLLYLVGVASGILPKHPAGRHDSLVPAGSLQSIRSALRDDWLWCMEYVKNTRPLLFAENQDS